jgi:CheY-like chemotaxis protein
LPKGEGGRVLVVDDNDRVREFASDLLHALGYETETAASAEEALETLDACAVDILFSDIVMPGTSGVALARKVRETRPDLPILLASGYAREVIEGAAAEFDLIAKPYSAEELSTAVRARLCGR